MPYATLDDAAGGGAPGESRLVRRRRRGQGPGADRVRRRQPCSRSCSRTATGTPVSQRSRDPRRSGIPAWLIRGEWATGCFIPDPAIPVIRRQLGADRVVVDPWRAALAPADAPGGNGGRDFAGAQPALIAGCASLSVRECHLEEVRRARRAPGRCPVHPAIPRRPGSLVESRSAPQRAAIACCPLRCAGVGS